MKVGVGDGGRERSKGGQHRRRPEWGSYRNRRPLLRAGEWAMSASGPRN